jgi:hypothetical protein
MQQTQRIGDEMKKFVLVQYGYSQPTPEMMDGWMKWFASIADKTVENVGPLGSGREVSKTGTKDLPMGLDSLTGITVINAESMADAEKIAQACPMITSVRVYEVMSM